MVGFEGVNGCNSLIDGSIGLRMKRKKRQMMEGDETRLYASLPSSALLPSSLLSHQSHLTALLYAITTSSSRFAFALPQARYATKLSP